MENIYFANTIAEINPFSPNGEYCDKWVELSITNSTEYKEMTGRTILFGFKVRTLRDGWQFRAMDFIEYNTLLGKNIIFTGTKNSYEEAKKVYQGHSIYDRFLRSYEPAVLIHSTTDIGYQQIIKDDTLKSWNKIKNEHDIYKQEPIGALLGDPPDFSDYIMLGRFGFWNEIVVSSKQKGNICMDADCEYTPGARFYFDTKQLIREGLFVRDGAHYKVRDELPLSYALFCATLDNVAIDGAITPRSFSIAADKAFEKTMDQFTL